MSPKGGSILPKSAVLGVVYGLVAGTLCAALSGHYPIAAGAFGGFVGGLAGGITWSLLARRYQRVA